MSNTELKLKATDAQVRAWYKTATPEVKAILEESKRDTPGFFSTNIMDRVKSLPDALAETGETIEEFNERTKGLSLDNRGNEECKVWAKALNEGWEADWADHNQPKYYPRHEVVRNCSGFGLSYHAYDCTVSHTNVGSRLRYKSAELAIHAGKHAISSYERLLLG